MNRIVICGIILILTTLPLSAAQAGNTNVFEFHDGDRVLLIGDALIAREPRFGQIEFLLATRFSDREMTVRNLGWDSAGPGNTIPGSLSPVHPPDTWLRHLLSQTGMADPTVAFVGFGVYASRAGQAGLGRFKQWMTRLLEELRDINPAIRLVLLSPPRKPTPDSSPPGLPPDDHLLGLYVRAIGDLADQYEAHFVDLFENLNNNFFFNRGPSVFEDGIHLNHYGYRRAAEVIAQGLHWYPSVWQIGITQDGRLREGCFGTEILELERTRDKIRVVTRDEMLPPPPWTETERIPPLATPSCRLQFQGLAEGNYELRVDGQKLIEGPHHFLGRDSGLRISSGPPFQRAQDLIAALREKNELCSLLFWPYHDPDRFVIRHKKPACPRENPILDPLIRAAEERIAKLRKPVVHTYELVLISEKR